MATPVSASPEALDDLSTLPNLKHLDVMMQNISDLSPLYGLPIEYLNVAGNNIRDISPFESLSELQSLTIDGNPVSDLSALASLESLRVFNASDTNVR